MMYPSIDKLLNVIPSKYILVHLASRRSKQMLETRYYQMKQNEYVNIFLCNKKMIQMNHYFASLLSVRASLAVNNTVLPLIVTF